MADPIPQHLALPFRIVGTRAVAVDQDSDAEILQSVEVLMRYRPGDREAVPDFGVPGQAHRQGGADLVTVAERVELWEPRVRAVAESMGLEVGGLLQQVRVKVQAAPQEG